jgi:hypothetical protein
MPDIFTLKDLGIPEEEAKEREEEEDAKEE